MTFGIFTTFPTEAVVLPPYPLSTRPPLFPSSPPPAAPCVVVHGNCVVAVASKIEMKGTSTRWAVERGKWGLDHGLFACTGALCMRVCVCVRVCPLRSCAFLVDSLLNYATCAKVAPKSRLKIARIEASGLENCLIGCNFEFKYFHKATQREIGKMANRRETEKKLNRNKEAEATTGAPKNGKKLRQHAKPLTDSPTGISMGNQSLFHISQTCRRRGKKWNQSPESRSQDASCKMMMRHPR